MKRQKLKTKFTPLRIALIAGIVTISAGSVAQAAMDLFPGDSESYALLYEGAGSHNLTLNTAPEENGATVLGNVGLATQLSGNPAFKFNNPAVIQGNVNFAGTDTTKYQPAGGILHGTTNFGVASVNTDMSAINTLSQTWGGLTGQPLVISGNTLVEATDGDFDAALDAYVFTVTSLNLANGQTLTIDGQDSGANVILNDGETSGIHMAGAISLTGGLSADNVFYNMYGGNFSTLTGGPTFQTAANGAEQDITYLDPNGNINIDSVDIEGHVFGGDSADMQVVSGATVQIVPEPGIAALAGFAALSMILLHRRKIQLV